MNQLQRDMRAVRTVLQQTGGTYRDEIALRAGEELGDAIRTMLESGEIETRDEFVPSVGRVKTIYRLSPVRTLTTAQLRRDLQTAGFGERFSEMLADYLVAVQGSRAKLEEYPSLPSRESIDKVDAILKEAMGEEKR